MPRWRNFAYLLLFLAGFILTPFREISAHEGTAEPLDQVSFDQKINAQLPLALEFTDENGRQVRLEQYFAAGKPVILLFAYYQCSMLCPLVLEDLNQNLQHLSMDAGEQFEILTVSMDAGETPSLAARKKAELVQAHAKPGVEDGWHFLTGEHESIHSLADAVGMQFAYDQDLQEYAHPAGLILLTPAGRISRYIFGLDYTPTDLRLGLVESSNGEIGGPIDQAFLLCYRYNPVTGKYNLLISRVIQLAAAGTVAGLAASVLVLMKRERNSKAQSTVPEPEGPNGV